MRNPRKRYWIQELRATADHLNEDAARLLPVSDPMLRQLAKQMHTDAVLLRSLAQELAGEYLKAKQAGILGSREAKRRREGISDAKYPDTEA